MQSGFLIKQCIIIFFKYLYRQDLKNNLIVVKGNNFIRTLTIKPSILQVRAHRESNVSWPTLTADVFSSPLKKNIALHYVGFFFFLKLQ